ncbi:MAG: ATP-grasp domain-containing protein [Planctomycetota bacterium]
MELILIGASCRAAAQSAVRAGYRPVAFDLYGDRDLGATCDNHVVAREDFPNALPELLRPFDAAVPVVFCGGLENHPRTLERLAETRPVLGCVDALADLRRPGALVAAFRDTEIRCPDVATFGDPSPSDLHGWLEKSVWRCGGDRVRAAESPLESADSYLERRVDGIALSAAFVADPNRCQCLGITRQLVGEPRFQGGIYSYCGSIAPYVLASKIEDQIRLAGERIADHFSLRGLFGIDFVADGSSAWVIEVNARYPASIEILEELYGYSAMELHVEACRGTIDDVPLVPVATDPDAEDSDDETDADDATDAESDDDEEYEDDDEIFVGKAILFAERDAVASIDWESRDGWPEIADLPPVGQRINAGEPVATVFARDTEFGACFRKLEKRAKALEESLASES